MADRLGLLTGRDLSPVAVLGVRMLLYADNLARAREQEAAKHLQMRLALLAAGGDARQLFSEVFAAIEAPKEVETVQEPEQEAVDWKVPSVDEWARVSAALAQRQVSVPTPDLDDGGWI